MNTPNKITLSRLLLLPLIVFFYLADFIPYGRLVATIIFIIACLTDFVDGYIARKHNQVTDLGKFFDTIADKVLIMTGLILIIAGDVKDSAPVVYPSWLGIICAIIMLAREFIVSALRQVAASKGLVLAADKGGKIKATVQYIAVTLYMAFAFVLKDIIKDRVDVDSNTALTIVRYILMIILIVATLLTIYTGASYLIRNRRVFKSENTPKTTEKDNTKEEQIAGVIEENKVEGVPAENNTDTQTDEEKSQK